MIVILFILICFLLFNAAVAEMFCACRDNLWKNITKHDTNVAQVELHHSVKIMIVVCKILAALQLVGIAFTLILIIVEENM